MKIVKYNDKIVKYDENIVVEPDPPPNYSTHSFKYSTNNCTEACGVGTLNFYYSEIVIILSLDDIIYTDTELTTTTSSGYYSDNIKCYWLDGDGIIVQIDDCL